MTLGSVPEAVTEQDLDEDRNASRQGKSDSAYRTISEVANDLNLPQHVLRFWESKFKQISPLKRGGGRRYYRPQDVDLIKRIHHLLHTQGYTIKGVQKLFVKDRLLEQSVKSGPVSAANEQPAAINHTAPATQQALFTEPGAKTNQTDLQLLLTRLKNLRDHISARC